MSEPQVFINGEPAKGWRIVRTATFIRPRYARFPRWLLRLLEQFGITTTEEKQVNLWVTAEAPTAKATAVMVYKTDYGDTSDDETTC